MKYNETGKAVHDITLGVQNYGLDSFSKVLIMKQNDTNSHVIHAKIKDKHHKIKAQEVTNAKLKIQLSTRDICFIDGVFDKTDLYFEIPTTVLKFANKHKCEVQIRFNNASINYTLKASQLLNVNIDKEILAG